MALMQIDFGTPQYNLMVALREEVLRKPLGLQFSDKELAAEKEDILIAAFEEGKILGCCILTPHSTEKVQLRQMAVSPKCQRKGIGQQLLRFAENLAKDRRYKELTMHARDSAIGFYEKLGYKIVGEPFVEVTIPHHEMIKLLI